MAGPFTTKAAWELDWSYDCTKVTDGHDWLILAVYRQSDADPTIASLFDNITPEPMASPGFAAGVSQESQATSVAGPKGTFYLKITTECAWHVLVK